MNIKCYFCLFCNFLLDISIVAHDCSILPRSINPGFEEGCKGAVYHTGQPAKNYCENSGTAYGKYPWYEDCCKWENDECVPKTSGKFDNNVLFLYLYLSLKHDSIKLFLCYSNKWFQPS